MRARSVGLTAWSLPPGSGCSTPAQRREGNRPCPGDVGRRAQALDVDAARCEPHGAQPSSARAPATVRTGADCTRLDAWWDGRTFDPRPRRRACSASGVARRHPDRMAAPRERPAGVSPRASGILDALWQVLAPNGKLLYVTCSVFPQETRRWSKALSRTRQNARRLPLPDGEPQQWLAWGPEHDGFFYALIQNTPDATRDAPHRPLSMSCGSASLTASLARADEIETALPPARTEEGLVLDARFRFELKPRLPTWWRTAGRCIFRVDVELTRRPLVLVRRNHCLAPAAAAPVLSCAGRGNTGCPAESASELRHPRGGAQCVEAHTNGWWWTEPYRCRAAIRGGRAHCATTPLSAQAHSS